MKVYAVSCKTPKNIEEMVRILIPFKEAEPGSLVCFPEYFLDKHRRYTGIKLKDRLVTTFLESAEAGQIYLASGMIEKDQNKKYITGILVGPNGEIIGKQRKINLIREDREAGIFPGESREIIQTDFGTVAISVCNDQRELEQNFDAEIIIHPRGFGLNDPQYGRLYDKWLLLDKATAMLNGAYIIGITGDYSIDPLSDIINYEGTTLAESNKGGVISTEIDLDSLRKYRQEQGI
jgi:predicted amidohydrolase